jgi:hypothetical protein
LHNIKGAIYYLQNPSRTGESNEKEFFEIIEREVSYLVSYVDEGIRQLEMEHVRMFGREDAKGQFKLE